MVLSAWHTWQTSIPYVTYVLPIRGHLNLSSCLKLLVRCLREVTCIWTDVPPGEIIINFEKAPRNLKKYREILCQSSGDFDPEAHPKLKISPHSSEIWIRRNYLNTGKYNFKKFLDPERNSIDPRESKWSSGWLR